MESIGRAKHLNKIQEKKNIWNYGGYQLRLKYAHGGVFPGPV